MKDRESTLLRILRNACLWLESHPDPRAKSYGNDVMTAIRLGERLGHAIADRMEEGK